MPSGDDPITAAQLAKSLGLNGRWLRQLIRDHRLASAHVPHEHYRLQADDIERTKRHPAVRQAAANRSNVKGC